MTLIVKTAKTSPVRIELDLDTDIGPIKGHFTGHARIRSKKQLMEFADSLAKLAEEAPENADETILREMFASFDGLGNESGPLSGDDAFVEVLTGLLSVHLTRLAMDAYWAHLGGAREGNAPPRRAR